METAKVQTIGKDQTILIPQEFQLLGNEVIMHRIGRAVVLLPKDALWQVFLDGLNGFTKDCFADGREQEVSTKRDSL